MRRRVDSKGGAPIGGPADDPIKTPITDAEYHTHVKTMINCLLEHGAVGVDWIRSLEDEAERRLQSVLRRDKRRLRQLTASGKLPGCRGWNFHVFTLGADRCSLCAKTRTEIEAEGRRRAAKR